MPVERCPPCGRYLLSLDSIKKVLRCYSSECGYTEPVDVDNYLSIHNELPILAAPIETEEITKTIEELSTSGAFQKVKELDTHLKDCVRRALEARRKKAEREMYSIDRMLKLFQ